MKNLMTIKLLLITPLFLTACASNPIYNPNNIETSQLATFKLQHRTGSTPSGHIGKIHQDGKLIYQPAFSPSTVKVPEGKYNINAYCQSLSPKAYAKKDFIDFTVVAGKSYSISCNLFHKKKSFIIKITED